MAQIHPSGALTPLPIAGICLVLGILIGFLMPLHPFGFWPAVVLGVLLTAAGGAVAALAYNTLDLHGGAPGAGTDASHVITHGPYRISRNPFYLGGAVLYVGIALLFDAGWALLLLVPVLLIVRHQVITVEEPQLESRYGQFYMEYKARTRRWL